MTSPHSRKDITDKSSDVIEMDQQIKQTVINNLVSDYETIYNKMTFISDVEARVRAANGIMIYLSHVNDYGASVLPPTESVLAASSKVEDLKISDDSIIGKALGLGASSTPQPPMPAPSEDKKQLGIDGKPLPAYDRSGLKWIRCPVCQSVDIDIWSEKKQRYFQGCFDCQIWLIPDGKTRPMDQKPIGDDGTRKKMGGT